MPFKMVDSSSLQSFGFERVLNEDPMTRTIYLLGTLPDAAKVGRSNAILKIERSPLDAEEFGAAIRKGLIQAVEVLGITDIYTWCLGTLNWAVLGNENGGIRADVKIGIIFPATDVHVRKYTKQEMLMVQETPEVYDRIVKPYIAGFPKSRTQWVEDILTGVSEADKVLYSCSDFMIIPDMKWDLQTMSALYLVAIVRDGEIRSLRDLRERHLPMLKVIKEQAGKVVEGKWNFAKGGVRMFVHYQPSYYHFHVHIVHVSQTAAGMNVGHAHLLDDIISLLEIDGDIFAKMTLTYVLGDQHSLFKPLSQV